MLQGGSKLITDLFDCIKAFKQTLGLYEEQLKNGNLEQFPHLKEKVEANLAEEGNFMVNFDEYI